MWILPSRGRPHLIAEFIKAWHETKASTKLVLALDDDDPNLEAYQGLELPPTWQVYIGSRQERLGDLWNAIYAGNPHEEWYGGLGDDVYPLTLNWDVTLIKACLPNKIAYPNDLINGHKLCTHLCIGGDLVREMGWFILPGLDRVFGDNVWMDIGRKKNALVYFDDVILEHRHFSTGKNTFDETSKKPNSGMDRAIYERWRAIYMLEYPLIICTVNWKDYCGQGVNYSNILYDMVRRNLPDGLEGRFIVFTDKIEEGYLPGIEQELLPEGITGWWNKLYLFKRGVFSENSRIIYFDLDTAIVGGLDNLVSYTGDFAILRDFWRPKGLGSGVMAWKAGVNDYIWDLYCQKGCPQIALGGDQSFIEEAAVKPDILQDLYPGWFYSYKSSGQFGLPRHSKVICFHGEPKPHQVRNNWVEHIWKVGGGSIMELELVNNVDEKRLLEQIEENVSKPHEHLGAQYMKPTEVPLCIIGGGPSLKEDLPEIRKRQQDGEIIWALNNSFKYLINNDIYPDAQILLDGREENIEFVPDSTKALILCASQCHPSVVNKAIESGKVIIWDRYIEGLLDILDKYKLKSGIVGSGSSVGINAIALAQLFGFKRVHLFGYDSSYQEDRNHAYDQPLNDGERVIDVVAGERSFRCAPWMASQVDEFRNCIPDFIKQGMSFEVHGNGLLPYVASLMAEPQ